MEHGLLSDKMYLCLDENGPQTPCARSPGTNHLGPFSARHEHKLFPFLKIVTHKWQLVPQSTPCKETQVDAVPLFPLYIVMLNRCDKRNTRLAKFVHNEKIVAPVNYV